MCAVSDESDLPKMLPKCSRHFILLPYLSAEHHCLESLVSSKYFSALANSLHICFAGDVLCCSPSFSKYCLFLCPVLFSIVSS